MASWCNRKLMRWQADEWASSWIGMSMKCQVDEIASQLCKKIDENEIRQNGNLTKWQYDKVTQRCCTTFLSKAHEWSFNNVCDLLYQKIEDP